MGVKVKRWTCGFLFKMKSDNLERSSLAVSGTSCVQCYSLSVEIWGLSVAYLLKTVATLLPQHNETDYFGYTLVKRFLFSCDDCPTQSESFTVIADEAAVTASELQHMTGSRVTWGKRSHHCAPLQTPSRWGCDGASSSVQTDSDSSGSLWPPLLFSQTQRQTWHLKPVLWRKITVEL